MQLHSFTSLLLSLVSVVPALAAIQGHDSLRSVRSHVANLNNRAIEAAVRDMAQEHANNFVQRGGIATSCRALVKKDIMESLTNRQIAALVNYTNTEILDKLKPGMTMFDLETFRNPESPHNFSRTVGNWRVDYGYWDSGVDDSQPSQPPPPSTGGDNGGGGGGGGSVWDDFEDWFSGYRRGSMDRREGVDFTTWYWSPLSEFEVEDQGLPRAQICLNVTQAVSTILDKGECSLARFDAHGSMADGGEVQVSIQQATTLTTTVSTERTSSAGESLSSTFSGGVEFGYEGVVVAKGHAEYARTSEAHWDVSNTMGTETETSSSITNTVQITFDQKEGQTCSVELSTVTCRTKLRLVTPITLSGLLHVQSGPYCIYNKDANGECKKDLFIDLEKAMKGFNTDAVIVQYIDAALTSTGTYSQKCVDNKDATEGTPNGSDTNVTPVPPSSPITPGATLTVYGHTATNYALTTTVAEKTATKTVITDFYQPTTTVFKHVKDVATATVFTKTTVVTAADAKKVTITSTRRPRASTERITSTVRSGVRTVTEAPTTTVVKRVTKTLKPTPCRRSLDEEDEDFVVRTVPTAAPVVKREAVGAAAGVSYAATTTLSDATTTFTDPVHPTTVTATGSTTTVTQAASGTQTLAAVTTTDMTNTQFRFVTASAVSTEIVAKVTRTKTVSRPARTLTVTNTVTRASSTKTVQGATVTVKKTRTSTVTPRCTRRA